MDLLIQQRSDTHSKKNKLKEALFKVLLRLMKLQKTTLFSFIIQMFILYIQNINLILYKSNYMSSPGMRSFIQYSIGILSVYPFIDCSQTLFVLIFLYISVVICFIIFALVLYSILAEYFKVTSNMYFMDYILSFIFSKIKILKIPLAGCLILPLQINQISSTPWEGIDLMHKIFAIISIVLLEALCFIIDIFLIDIRIKTKNETSKLFNYNGILEHLCRIIILLLTIIICNETSLIISAFIIAILFGAQLYLYSDKINYFHPQTNMWWKIYSALSSFIGIAYILGYFLIGKDNNTGIAFLILGSFAVGFWTYAINRIHSADSLLIFTDIKRSESLIENLSEKIIMTEQFTKSKSFQVTLKGIIYKHTDHCENPDCPLTILKKMTLSEKNVNFFFKKVIKHCNDQLRNFIHKIKDKKLALFFCLFQIDYALNFTIAQKELDIYEKSAGIIMEFQIYVMRERLMKKMSKKTFDKSLNIDYNAMLNYEIVLSKFKKRLKKTTEMHLELWALLGEQLPNLRKLNKYGIKILYSLEKIKADWNIIKEFKINTNKELKLYMEFSNEILHDFEYIKELNRIALEKSETNSSLNNIDIVSHKNASDHTFSKSGTPLISINCQHSNYGKIASCNQPFVNLFGYSKMFLIGEDISIIMPDIYHEYHKAAILEFIKENEIEEKNTFSKKNGFGRHKAKYIFPITEKIISFSTIEGYDYLLSSIKPKKKFINAFCCFLIIDPSFRIVNCSSSSDRLLGINNKNIEKNDLQVKKIFPDLFSEGKKYFHDEGDFINLSSQHMGKFLKRINDCRIENESNYQDLGLFRAFLSKIKFKNSLIGYSLMLEKIIQKKEAISLPDISNKLLFEFSYVKPVHKFLLEIVDQKRNESGQSKTFSNIIKTLDEKNENKGNPKSKIDEIEGDTKDDIFTKEDLIHNATSKGKKGFIFTTIPNLINFSLMGQNSIGIDTSEKFLNEIVLMITSKNLEKDYCSKIHVYRFNNGEFEVVDQDSAKNISSQSEIEFFGIEEDHEGSVHLSKNDSRNSLKLIKSKAAFVAKIKESPISIQFTILNIISLAFFFIIIGLGITCFVYQSLNFSQYYQIVSIIKESNDVEMQCHKGIYLNKQLILLKNQILSKNVYKQTSQEIILDLRQTLADIYLTTDDLLIDSINLPIVNDYLNYYQNDTLTVFYKISDGIIKNDSISLIEAVNELSSMSLGVINNFSQLSDSDPSLYFVLQNGLNLLSVKLDEFHRKIANSAKNYIGQSHSSVIAIFIISCIISIVQIPILIIFISFAERLINKIFKMFLDVPNNVFTKFEAKAQYFIASFSSEKKEGNISENSSELSIDKVEEGTANQFMMARRAKNFSSVPSIFWKILCCLLLFCIILFLYFLLIYFKDSDFKDKIVNFVNDYPNTGNVASTFQMAINFERENFEGSSYQLLLDDRFKTVKSFIDIIISLAGNLSSLKGGHFNLLNDNDMLLIKKIMFGDLCNNKDWVPFNSQEECHKFDNGNGAFGLNALLSDFSLNYKLLLTEFLETPGDAREKALKMFSDSRLAELYLLEVQFINPFNDIIHLILTQSVNNFWNSLEQTRILVFVLFIIVSVFLYFVVLRITYQILIRNYLNAKMMISILPLDIILGLRNLKKYILVNEDS